jgi:hypothetical protein
MEYGIRMREGVLSKVEERIQDRRQGGDLLRLRPRIV